RRLAGREAVNLEADGNEGLLEHVEHLALGGGDAAAGDEAGGEVDGIDCGGHGAGLASEAGGMKCRNSTWTRSSRSTARAIRLPMTRRWRSGIIAGLPRRQGWRTSAPVTSCWSRAASPRSATGTRVRTSWW